MKPLGEDSRENSPQKEDHLSPTKIEQDNQPDPDKGTEPNLSHKELKDRLDLYSSIGGKMEQYFKVQGIKDKYLNQIRELEANRTKADINYAQGIRTGLPHLNHGNIKDMRATFDQELRNETGKSAKDVYKEKSSLTKSFEENMPHPSEIRRAFEKTKNKGMDMDR